jgi:hypothetical protein
MPGIGNGAAASPQTFRALSYVLAVIAPALLLCAGGAWAEDNGAGDDGKNGDNNGNNENGDKGGNGNDNGNGAEETFKRIATIQVPGNPLKAFDISWFDPQMSAYLLADRSNASLDVIDTKNNKVLFQVGGFVGVAGSCASGNVNDCSGPDGVVTIHGGKEAWVGDGPDKTKVSSVKVVNLVSRKIVDTIYTGGSFRSDEMAWDSRDEILLVANDADTPPFVTFISTTTRKILGTLKFVTATNGLEQSAWWPKTGLFYLSVPEIGGHKGHGAIAVINPTTMKVVRHFPIDCEPAGLAIGPENFALAGCSDGPVKEINLRSGEVVRTFDSVGMADEVWFNPGDGHFYVAAGSNTVGGNPAPVLGVIDAQTKKFDTNIKSQVGDHSVAADSTRNHIFLPSVPNASDTKCTNGCIIVYACTASSGGGEDDQGGGGNSQNGSSCESHGDGN